jgi:hypothetical protein
MDAGSAVLRPVPTQDYTTQKYERVSDTLPQCLDGPRPYAL